MRMLDPPGIPPSPPLPPGGGASVSGHLLEQASGDSGAAMARLREDAWISGLHHRGRSLRLLLLGVEPRRQR